MDNHNAKIEKYLQSLEALSHSTDDYLFVLDINHDRNWFFGDVETNFDLHANNRQENTMAQIMSVVYPNDLETLAEDLRQIKQGERKSHDITYRWVNRAGRPVWINCRGKVIDDDQGKPMVLLGRVSTSVFENKVNRITGMFNKRKMLEDSQAQQFMSKDGYILLLGLDRMLKCYSEFGREYMENIILNCAKHLEEMTNGKGIPLYHAEDAVFAVCYEDATREEIQSFYAEITKRVKKCCTITAVALPTNKQYFTDERELYETATEELIKAKKAHRAKLSFYSKKSIVEQLNERDLEEKLERAINNNNFEGFHLCYQPQIRGKDYELDGVEALLRFTADNVEYSPGKFIPILEQLGLIHEVGLWTLRTSIEQVKAWREYLPDLCLNVNFSLSQFTNPNAIDSILSIYKESGLPPHVLTLELTENVKAEDLEQVTTATKTWKAAGIDISLDDFGSGYSNLVMLKEIQCDEIKIERAFISRIKPGSYSYMLASSIIGFAHQNNICVCCEGVETERDVLTLSPLKPDLYQGFVFDKGLIPKEFETRYINKKSSLYKKRISLKKRLIAKDEERITRFDPNEILTNINVGLCVMMWDRNQKIYEVHPDELMEKILGMPANLTPLECNDFWFTRIKDGYEGYVRSNLRKLIIDTEVIQFIYPWIHPEKGEILLSFSGVRTISDNGKITVKALQRVVTTIEKTGFNEESRPLKYFIENRYMDIVLSKAIAFMEINVTQNKVVSGFHDLLGNQPAIGDAFSTMVFPNGDLKYNEFEIWWADHYLIKCDKDFYQISHCDYLAKAYEQGEKNIELLCQCEDREGKVYDCKKSLFITRDEFNGDIMALCVIYDVSDETKARIDLLHREATIRSLADDYKSIMYINLDEDTVAFYREDNTLGDWKIDTNCHSIMVDIFAERFVAEENKAEYKYLSSTQTMREKLSQVNEYRFEYVRKCKEGPRHHEMVIKRDLTSDGEFCAIIAVKDIQEEVQLRIQLEEALKLAYTDHLTGLYNQQGLLSKAKEILKDPHLQAAVLFMDLDNFKRVNDVYGHGMGDKVLYEVGKAVREETRGKDIVGRYGGDEFVVLIPGIKKQRDAEEVAERISGRVKDICKHLKLSVNITASIGISFTEQTGNDYHRLKEIADDRLYLAKKRGKNRIVKKF